MKLSKLEVATIVAAPSHYARTDDSQSNLGAKSIIDLAKRIADETVPTVVIKVDGCAVHAITTNAPMNVIIIDDATETCDPDLVHQVGGAKVGLIYTSIGADHKSGNGTVDPTYVDLVKAQVEQIRMEATT